VRSRRHHLGGASLTRFQYATRARPVGSTCADIVEIREDVSDDTVWRPAVRRAGVPRGTGFHDLRHYYARCSSGTGVRQGRQARLGHASRAESLDNYSHLWPDSEDRTRRAIDAVLGAPAASVPGLAARWFRAVAEWARPDRKGDAAREDQGAERLLRPSMSA
jgi:hypothetical protein